MKRADAERLAARLLLVGFEGSEIDAHTEGLIARGVRAFVLFSRNVAGVGQAQALAARIQEMCQGEATVAVDQEGGTVTRLRRAAPEWPSQMAVAATGDVELARRAAAESGAGLRNLGITWNLAPVADVLRDHRNPALGTRAFSDDPAIVAAYTAAMVEGYQSGGVAATLKHFPGHGNTPLDSHLSLPTVHADLGRLTAIDLVPFRAGVDAGARALMLSHVWYPALDEQPTPASVSPAAVRLARGQLAFEGVIVTDCLEMRAVSDSLKSESAAVRAVQAGCDLVAFSRNHRAQAAALAAIAGAVLDGSLDREQVMKSIERLEQLRENREPIVTQAADTTPLRIAYAAVTLLRDSGRCIPLAPGERAAVVRFSPAGSSAVVDAGSRSHLAEALLERKIETRDVLVTGPDDVEAAERACAGYRTVIVTTARVREGDAQERLVRRLTQTHARVIAVALRDPFDILRYPDVPCYLTNYGDTPADVEAIADVLVGAAPPRGSLPVEIPGLFHRRDGLHRT